MRSSTALLLFVTMILMPFIAYGSTLEPVISIGLLSKEDNKHPSMRLMLDYNHVIGESFWGGGRLVVSGGLFVDVKNGLGEFASNQPLDFNEVGAKVDLAWQHRLSHEVLPGLGANAFSFGASIEALLDANGQRKLRLGISPAFRWNMKLGGQAITILSKLNIGFGLDETLDRDFSQSYFNSIKRR